MIYLTGDIHGSLSVAKFSSRAWPEGKELTKNDYVIILGDFGLVWDGSNSDKYWLDWLESKPWTTLFIDGNHENFDLLAQYPVERWHGGCVQRIRPSVMHLMRGSVFDIDGHTFLAMGGAKSHDAMYRKEGVSWWPEETPSIEERETCERNLADRGWKVDYVLTHDVPACMVTYLARVTNREPRIDEFEQWLDGIMRRVTYRRWYCGHWHLEITRHSMDIEVLYDDIVPLHK